MDSKTEKKSQKKRRTVRVTLPNIIIFEGPDGTGKTNIALALAKKLKREYYRSPSQPEMWRGVKDVVDSKLSEELKNIQKWSKDRKQQVMDRSYLSEWVYSQVLNRYTNHILLADNDEEYAKAGALIILCFKDKYEHYEDEYFPKSKLSELKKIYGKMMFWTKCRVMILNTTDEDLQREIKEIMNYGRSK